MDRHATADRLRALYSGVIADALDGSGLNRQVLPAGIVPLGSHHRIAGQAFPGYGTPSEDPSENRMMDQLTMLEQIQPGQVCVLACDDAERSCAQWGEIMSRTMIERGCVGAVLDGGLRDTDLVQELDFPVFYGYHSPASSIGRWAVREWQCAVTIGGVTIAPGDWVMGDRDGVVVIPQHVVEDVLADSEKKAETEAQMRRELAEGGAITDLYARYGSV